MYYNQCNTKDTKIPRAFKTLNNLNNQIQMFGCTHIYKHYFQCTDYKILFLRMKL